MPPWLAFPVAVAVVSNHRPVVLPHHRLQVDEPPVGVGVLKVQEPPVTPRRVDERALMRAVDVAGTLREHDAILVGALHRTRAKYRLPPLFHPTGGGEDVIPAIALVEL